MNVGSLCVRHDVSSAAVVRAEIADDLAAQRITGDSVADVVLVASELVGNAIVHTTDDADLDIAWDVQDDTVILRVNDGGTCPPVPRRAVEGDTNGRGLAIVASIAADWGVSPRTHGKQVWARIPISHAV